jgi:hypothetical protein
MNKHHVDPTAHFDLHQPLDETIFAIFDSLQPRDLCATTGSAKSVVYCCCQEDQR